MLTIITDREDGEEFTVSLDEIARLGAERMLAVALIAEADAYVTAASAERDENNRALVVRNGYAKEREITCGAGRLTVKTPRVYDRRRDPETGEAKRFASVIVPPYVRRSPKVDSVLPLLYLHGLSSGDFAPALEEFFGSKTGLSASVVTRLVADWEAEVAAFKKRDLKGVDYVYIWVDGVHFKIRLGPDRKLCCLVMIGVRADGTKELVAIEEGYRESTDSWAELLRDLKRRGMRAPMLAVGDGALGFWGAISEVFPETRHQRDWVHKTSNVLDALPKSVHSRAKAAIFEITNAEGRDQAEAVADRFVDEFGTKWPKAASKISDDKEALLAFYDFPQEHWVHLRTTNPIESTFAPVRARTNLTKGPGSRATGFAMVFKLIEAAQQSWRKVNGPELVALVRAGAKFENGKLVHSYDRKDAA